GKGLVAGNRRRRGKGHWRRTIRELQRMQNGRRFLGKARKLSRTAQGDGQGAEETQGSKPLPTSAGHGSTSSSIQSADPPQVSTRIEVSVLRRAACASTLLPLSACRSRCG